MKKFEDDGRTVADMSSLDGNSSFLFRKARQLRQEKPKPNEGNMTEEGLRRPPYEDAPFTFRERIHYVGMALAASLAIAAVFLSGIALIIWLITLYA